MRGKVWRFGAGVNTDLIFPGWMNAKVKSLDDLSAGAMAGVDPDFHRKVGRGDLVVAGPRFGCGSSRETAPLSLRHAGVAAVVAPSFGRIFYRNCVNVGLWPVRCAGAESVPEGVQAELDLEAGLLRLPGGVALPAEPPAGAARAVAEAGGLMAYLRARGWDFA
jgi:3-isopropylmalate/(R)-2-methylmalate dehydratase small subunit